MAQTCRVLALSRECEAGDITARINAGEPVPTAEEQPRADTRGVCGDANNGFITQVDWNHFGDGTHTVVAYDNGVEFTRSTFTVVTTGEEFLRGASRRVEIPDFPAPGETATLVWNESTQHFELAAVKAPGSKQEPTPEPVPESEPLAPGACYYERWTKTGRIHDCLPSTATINHHTARGYSPLSLAVRHNTKCRPRVIGSRSRSGLPG